MAQQFLTDRNNLIQVGGSTLTLGQKTQAASLPVTLASDQTNLVTTINSSQGTPTHTQPSITTATSFTLAAANSSRKYLLVQNDSAANIMINLAGGTLTGIIPTSTNKGIVLTPGSAYESPAQYCSVAIITGYQTSGSTINTVSVIEG